MNRCKFARLLCLALIPALALSFSACDKNPSDPVTGTEDLSIRETETDRSKSDITTFHPSEDSGTENASDVKTDVSDTDKTEASEDISTSEDSGDDATSEPESITSESDEGSDSEDEEDLPPEPESDPEPPASTTDTATAGSKSTVSTASKPSTDRTSDQSTATTSETSPKPISSSTKSSVSSSKPTQSETVNSDTEPEDTPSQPPANTDISPISPENYYGRTWLAKQSNGAKLIKTYEELAAGIGARKETFSLSAGITEQELITVWNCYRADYPQHFWLGFSYRYEVYNNGIVATVTPAYTMTKAQKDAAQTKFDAAVKKILSGIGSGMTQYEIEKTIHDRLILACRYNGGTNAHTAYGALVDGVAVCEGFARAFQYLCRTVGIQTLFVQGSSENPSTGAAENHAWNVIEIDGQYYHVDVTWDNTDEPAENRIHYAWFNVTTARIGEDHVLRQEGYPAPACTATTANYFKKTGGEIPVLTVDDVLNRTKKQSNEFFFQAYVTNQSDVSKWFERNAATIAQRYGLNGYEYNLLTLGKEVCLIMKEYKG